MKFIDNHEAKDALLKRWAQPFQLVTASFYFWNSGASMQKCLQGLLQTILYRILSNCPALIKLLCPDRWISDESAEVISTEWTLAELESVFHKLENEHTLCYKFFFLIDGLDECDGDLYELIFAIQRLAGQSHLKLCVSSRPWNQFQHTIGTSNCGFLELHKFTRKDIELFARQSISSHSRRVDHKILTEQYDGLVHEIAERAQGVFLWVRLVVHSLREGIANDDQTSLLMKRLEEIPTALGEFFEHLLASVDRVYHDRMARAFLAALTTDKPLTLLHYSFLDEDDPYYGWNTSIEALRRDDMAKKLSQTRWRLNGRYLGLLEPVESLVTSDLQNDTVHFLHRTLRDYLRIPKMQQFLCSRAPPGFSPAKAVAAVSFATILFLTDLPVPEKFVDVLEFSNYAAQTSQESLFEYEVIDKVEDVIKSTWNTAMPSYIMLWAAVHIRHIGYLRYKVNQMGNRVDIDWILAHTVTGHCSSHSFVDHFSNADTVLQLYLCTCPVMDSFNDKDRQLQDHSFVNTLKQEYANGTASVFLDTSWLQHETTFETYLGGVSNRKYWNILRLLMRKGRIVRGTHKVWSRIAFRARDMIDTDLMPLIEGFSFLLKHYVLPDMRTFAALLFSLNDKSLSPRISSLWGQLLPMFLTRGINITRSILERYNFGAASGTEIDWLNLFIQQFQCGRTSFFGLDAHILFETFLQHGLEPNETLSTYSNTTIWKHFLISCLATVRHHTPHYFRIQGKLILVFLKYRADPNLAELDKLLGCRAGQPCRFTEPEATQIKKMIRTERTDLASRQDPAGPSHVQLMNGSSRKAVVETKTQPRVTKRQPEQSSEYGPASKRRQM
jgi:hypothetical protein